MDLREPTTLLTDYLIAACSLYFWHRLQGRYRERRQFSVWLWATGFLAAGAASLAGGTFHGFAAYLSPTALTSLWNLTVFLIGISGGFMLSGSFVADLSRRLRQTRLMLTGVVVSAVGFVIQQIDFEVHEHFNHNDIYHLIQLGGFYAFYRGALFLEDREKAGASRNE